MAIFHLSVKSISRSAGRSATAAAAYRSGDEITDERTGEQHDYTRRSGVADAFLVLPERVPVWAQDRAALWNQVEAAERRKNSQVAREVIVALPAELDAIERRETVREFARFLVERHQVAVDVAIHEPGREGDHRNHHAHLLLSTRQLGPEGLGAKTRELDVRGTASEAVRAWRGAWADIANRSLERAGHAERIDHRSLEAQGIEREPTQHLGPAAMAMQRADERRDSTRAAEVQERAAVAKQTERAVMQAAAAVVALSGQLDAARGEQRNEGMAAARVRAQAWRADQIEQGMAAARTRFAEQRQAERQRQEMEQQQREKAEREAEARERRWSWSNERDGGMER